MLSKNVFGQSVRAAGVRSPHGTSYINSGTILTTVPERLAQDIFFLLLVFFIFLKCQIE